MTAPAHRTAHRTAHERGAVLITVMLLVAVMATVAVALLDDVRFSVRRTANSGLTDQTRWYALGAETMAMRLLDESTRQNPQRTTLSQPWAQQSGQFPIPGGLIDGVLSDAGNCFNINSLVEQVDGVPARPSDISHAQFRVLLTTLGVPDTDAEALTARITDWIDADGQTSPRGAEDFDYMDFTPPYRTANALITDITELRAIDGVTPELYGLISPFLCALPMSDRAIMNVNTLREDQAPLLIMLAGPDLGVSDAAGILAATPSGGYTDVQEFLANPGFSGLSLSEEAQDQLDIKTGFFALNTTVVYGEAYIRLETLFDARTAGAVERVTRKLGEDV